MRLAPSILLALALVASAQARAGDPGEPDARVTPGALNPAVTQATIGETICRHGWTARVRPQVGYTEYLKRHQLDDPGSPYAVPGARLRSFEEDHRVPLNLGGAPSDPRNLWPEPRFGHWNAAAKDRLEWIIGGFVCRRRMTLDEGRAVFLGDWIAGYRKYTGEP